MIDWTSFWQQFMPPQVNQPWTPTYLPQQIVTEPNNAGGTSTQPLNVLYFPDAPSCEHLRAKYNPLGSITHVPLVGGPMVATAEVPYLVWPNGVAIMAGALAALWTQNPGHQDVADRLCRDAIYARGAV